MKPKFVVAILLVGAAAVGGFFVWAKAPYLQAEAIDVAQNFLSKMQAGDFNNAYELTTKNGYVGTTPAEMVSFAQRHTCLSGVVVATLPTQTNGNRLRRFIRRERVDLEEVRVEFVGDCLLGVSLRKNSQDEWRVYYFASHAG